MGFEGLAGLALPAECALAALAGTAEGMTGPLESQSHDNLQRWQVLCENWFQE